MAFCDRPNLGEWLDVLDMQVLKWFVLYSVGVKYPWDIELSETKRLYLIHFG